MKFFERTTWNRENGVRAINKLYEEKVSELKNAKNATPSHDVGEVPSKRQFK